MRENKTKGFAKGLDIFALAVVGILFAGINIWLLLLSGFSTSYISVQEKTYILGDNMLMHIISAVYLAALLVLIRRKKDSIIKAIRKLPFCHDMGFKQAKKLLLFIIFLMGAIWVLSAQLVPVADQDAVLKAAAGLRSKSYTLFAPGEYISRYPQQNGLLLIIYALGAVLGDGNYIVFQIINVFGTVFVYKLLSELGGMFGLSREGQLGVILTGIFFFPLTMYSSFVYGNILGLAFALAAIKQEMLAFRDGKTYRIFLSAVLIAISVLFKSNYLIFLIGMIICAILECIKQKKLRFLMLVLLSVLFCVGQAAVPKILIQLKTGYSMTSGVSSWSYAAMGLQDNPKRDAGWYNEYNDNTYNNADFDTNAQEKVCRENIAQSISDFTSGKRDAAYFFGRKTASQWNNPTFQCFWIAQLCSSNVQKSGWVRSVLSIPFTNNVSVYLGILQFWILLGSLLSIALCSKEWNSGAFILKILVVGGFIFHMVWEAKSQYTISYFVLMIPLSAAGYCALTDRLSGINTGNKTAKCRSISVLSAALCIEVLSFISPAFAAVIRPDYDRQMWDSYVLEHTPIKLSDGEYTVSPLSDNKLCLYSEKTENADSDKITLEKNKSVKIISYEDVSRIKIGETNRYLSVYSSGNRLYLSGADRENKQNQEWYITKSDKDGYYYIYACGDFESTIGEYALTADENGNITAESFDGSDNQKWSVAVK